MFNTEDFLRNFLQCIRDSGVQTEYLESSSDVTKYQWCAGPGFRVQSGRLFRFLWNWIGYRFPFNRIRIRVIQMN